MQRNVSSVGLLEGVEEAGAMPVAFRSAFVAPHLVDHQDSRLASDAGYTRGVFMAYFADEDAALAWLLAAP